MKRKRLPTDDKLRQLLERHGSFEAIAEELNCSATAVGARCRAMGLRSPRRRRVQLRCDRCRAASWEAKVIRFTLIRSVITAGRHRSRGAGGINLCEDCWNQTAGRRRRPRRPAE
jgi:hypothetical protein